MRSCSMNSMTKTMSAKNLTRRTRRRTSSTMSAKRMRRSWMRRS